MEFMKLIKPDVITNGDYDLQDVIESLALFYNPSVMNICKERLLNNTDISSVLNACLKTGNMSFLKAYSSILHNRIVGYGYLPKSIEVPHVGKASIGDLLANYNEQMHTSLNSQYSLLLEKFVACAGTNSGTRLKDAINTISNIIYRDILAGVMYDNINAYVTLLSDDADEKLSEVESIMAGETSDDGNDGSWYIDRLNRLYSEFEGNSNILHDIDEKNSIFEDSYGHTDAVPLGFKHLLKMLNVISQGSVYVEHMVDSIEKCAVHLNYSITEGAITHLPSEEYTDDLKECIRKVRLWIAEAMAIKNNWRSVMTDTIRFNHVILAQGMVKGVDVQMNAHVHEYLVGLYMDIVTYIPSIYGNVSNASKLDILKIIADAIDASIHSVILSTVGVGGIMVEGVHTEEYLRGWSLENYRALHEATIQMTDIDISVEDYEKIRTYKNPWER